MDELEQQIEERRVQLAAAQQQVTILGSELRAYEHALAIQKKKELANSENRQKAPPALPTAVVLTSRGTGSGTGHWVQIIDTLVRRQPRFTTDDVEREVRARGLNIKRKSIRSKLTELVKEKKVTRLSDGVYLISGKTPNDLKSLDSNDNGLARVHG